VTGIEEALAAIVSDCEVRQRMPTQVPPPLPASSINCSSSLPHKMSYCSTREPLQIDLRTAAVVAADLDLTALPTNMTAICELVPRRVSASDFDFEVTAVGRSASELDFCNEDRPASATRRSLVKVGRRVLSIFPASRQVTGGGDWPVASKTSNSVSAPLLA
jgi:hypothetical protein